MYDKIFNRVEQKYLLSNEEYQNFFNQIEDKLKKDKYFKTTICNIYFDNDLNSLIINSIEKPLYKFKIRVRSYGLAVSDDDKVFMEVKSKYKGTVGKRRIQLSLKEYENYMQKGLNNSSSQIMKEIDYLIDSFNLKPKIFIASDRLSYLLREDNNFRITFDFNLRSRRDELNFYSDKGDKYFDQNYVIMEIKTLGGIPLWFSKILSELKIYPTSFSKYGKIYQGELRERESEI